MSNGAKVVNKARVPVVKVSEKVNSIAVVASNIRCELFAISSFPISLSSKSSRCPIGFLSFAIEKVHPTGIPFDIVVNNNIALRNSSLLATYAAIDPRARTLIFLVKAWAKVH